MFTTSTFSERIKPFIVLFLLFISVHGVNSFSMENQGAAAQGGSKSNGKELLKAIDEGAVLKGMTKQQVIDTYGEPYVKGADPVKGRYDEKWTYSCETQHGLTYDCVMLYFMTDHVVSAESF